ncbi:O-antigen polymerase [Paenibacillus sp. DMB5]|uniref:O-antigen polymerase n=1 Tax=Paenibacillus sp. DMB5 TaxID=1780103 RepID=UPI0009EACE8E|nr:O-antigen polymerase [Paenibacillus sp. DMB5]
MLSLVFVTTAALFMFMGKFKTGKTFNPLTFFVGFWCFWAIVSMTNPYQMFAVSNKTYLLVWVQVVCVSLGYLAVAKKNLSAKFDLSEVGSKILYSRTFAFLQLFVLTFLTFYYFKYKSLLSSMTSNDMRRIIFEKGLLFSSSAEYMFYYWVITAIIYASLVIAISSFALHGKKNLSLFLVLINCFMFGQVGQGRLVYFYMMVFLAVGLGLKRDIYKNSTFKIKPKKSWGVYLVLILAVIFIMNRTSARRMGVSMSFGDSIKVFFTTSVEQFIIYFTGPFRTLDYFIQSNLVNVTGHTFGRSVFAGIEEILTTLLIPIGGSQLQANMANTLMASFTSPAIHIGGGLSFNAFYTSVMNFYMDGGLPMLICLSFAYGIIMGMLYNFCMNNMNIFTFSLLVYTTYNMITSEMRWNYSAPATWVVVFVLILGHRLYVKRTVGSKGLYDYKSPSLLTKF